MSGHLTAETAAWYAAHELTADEVSAIDAHIDQCSSCRVLVSMVAKSQFSTSSSGDDPVPGQVLPRGTRLGPFELLEPLEAGGMGLVYVARDTRLERQVAIKALRERRADTDHLLREARLMAQLTHPNVVRVYDVVEAQGQVFLAMELVVGRSLRQWLELAPRSWRQVVDCFVQAGAGLAAAHAAGIVHGDVKPANLLVGDDGRVRVTDFGLASVANELDEGGPRGTPAYLAPEQRRGHPCDAKADQYAFCVSLYEALFGVLPQHAAKSLGRGPRVPRGLRVALAKGLSDRPADRFASVDALLTALRRARSSTRRWAALASVVAVLAIALAFKVGGRRAETEQCAAAAAELASPWNDDARGLVRRSFTATRISYAAQTLERVERNLERWSTNFDAARRRACEPGWVTREVPLERLRQQLGCLTDSAREVRALVSQLRNADEVVVRNSVAASERLSLLERCESLPPRAVIADQPKLDQLRDQLAEVHALIASGKYRDAQRAAQTALSAAEALSDDALIGTAKASLGEAQARLADFDHAHPALLEAVRLADVAQDDRLRAAALTVLVQSEFWRGHMNEVLLLDALARGACVRVGDRWLESEVLLIAGGALSQLGRAAEARPVFERAVELRLGLYGEDDYRTSFALSSLGNALSMRGELTGGIDAHRRALHAAQAALGDKHPNVGILHDNLADDYLYGLQPEAAIAQFELGVRILETANPKARDVAVAKTDFGFALLEAGQAQRALDQFTQAITLWHELAPQHPVLAQSLLGVHQAQLALGRAAPASALEPALALSHQLPPFERGRIELALGEAVATHEPARALSLVRDAAAHLADPPLPLIARERARAEAYLAAHAKGGR